MNRAGVAAAVIGLAAAAGSFATWNAGSPTADSSRPGVDLFMSKGCASCHDGPQSTAHFPVAPSLANAAEWAGERKPDFSARAYIEESIMDPAAFSSPDFRPTGPISAMPTLNLSRAEVDALANYLLGQLTN